MLEHGVLAGTYGTKVVRRMREIIQKMMHVRGRHILVVGSSLPWIEVILLSEGAANVTTLDYFPFKSTHPKINVLNPVEMSKLIANGSKPLFDGVISFSSIEHSGLGRYGDLLNPWGDIVTMARVWCLMRSGGRAIIGVPTASDKICFNGNKYYGKILYNNVFANWKLLYSEIDLKMLSYKARCGNYNDLDYQPLTVWHAIDNDSATCI